jgi:malate synthase
VTVDAFDKTLIYRNWLGLMTGVLEATFEKDGGQLTRRLRADRSFTAPDGTPLTLPGRSLLLIRNVGMHMMTDIVQTKDGAAIPEGFLDALMTVTIAMYELRELGAFRNSATGSIYVVKPKMHGSAEVAFMVEVFAAVERLLDLPENTVKIGIMDEERRTSLNLANCIAAARHRVIFINTGFLDRTGDEIHTAMRAGPVVRKGDMRSTAWLLAYEQNNVDVALAMGFHGIAQIGKGMWAMPDAMAELVDTKIAHPRAGASCAWVPSPTAAALHAMHYHIVDVAARQDEIALHPSTQFDDLLVLPLLKSQPTSVEIAEELANNAQGILGYVVRWVGQGIGCSKVPDIKGVALMEDRATLRISSQHIANWLLHGLLERDAIVSTFVEMAALVDEQNANDSAYQPMLPDATSSPGVSAALELVFEGAKSPNGYTEDILNAWRRRVKTQEADRATKGAPT